MAEPNEAPAEDPYATLGVSRTASTQDIKKAFRQIARACHPDVAGADPAAAARFKRARAAYELLVDPQRRARFDRPEPAPGPTPFGRGWGAEGGGGFKDPGNDLDLDDLMSDLGGFADFGFGRGSSAGGARPRPRGAGGPRPGADIHVDAEVPEEVARAGGTVVVTYSRLKRSDMGDGVVRYEEIHDLRVPPGTPEGATLRVPRMGDAGQGGGPAGDLVCTVRLGRRGSTGPGKTRPAPPPGPGPQGTRADPIPLPVSVTEALLGGRVEVDVPGAGRIRLVVPPCSSSGTLLRFRRPAATLDESVHFAIQVVMPRSLDEESRALVEEFARLNPYDPRS